MTPVYLITAASLLASTTIANAGVQVTEALNGAAGTAVPAYTSAGVAAMAVGALVWTVKKAAGGDLVAKKTADTEKLMLELIADGAKRHDAQMVQQDRLIEIIGNDNRREDRLYRMAATGKFPKLED
jgi:hypothetical protein